MPGDGDENNADACYAHFDKVIEGLLRDGFGTDTIVVDFTRGTKAMRAALVLASVRHELRRLRYMDGARDQRGTVTAGTEVIGETTTIVALTHRRIDLARGLVEHGSFGAALELLPKLDHTVVAPFPASSLDLPAMRRLVEYLAAWDRLDYRTAQAIKLASERNLPPAWWRFCPSDEEVRWVTTLANQPQRDDHVAMADWLRPLMVDLLANAERRVAHGQFEDALVRAYRVLELIGQACLFRLGIDSERIPPDDTEVAELLTKIRKKKSAEPEENRDGTLKGSREFVARLLKRKKVGIAQSLMSFADRVTTLKPTSRNVSVLIHGFEAQAPSVETAWTEMINGLWELLRNERTDTTAAETFPADQAVARFLSFNIGNQN